MLKSLFFIFCNMMYALKERKEVDKHKDYLCFWSVSYLKIKKGHKMILIYLYGIFLCGVHTFSLPLSSSVLK